MWFDLETERKLIPLILFQMMLPTVFSFFLNFLL